MMMMPFSFSSFTVYLFPAQTIFVLQVLSPFFPCKIPLFLLVAER
jgi:hypothetical protein